MNMLQKNESNVNKFVAIDLHRKNFFATIFNTETEKSSSFKIPFNRESVKNFASTFDKKTNVVIESTQGASLLYDFFSKFANKVIVANPSKLRVIFDSYKKSDKNDTENLLELLIADKVPEVYIMPKEHREIWKLIKIRNSLTKTKTVLKNIIHSIIGSEGYNSPYSDLFGKKGKNFLLSLPLSVNESWMIQELLPEIERIEEKIKKIDERITAFALDKKEIQLLMTIPGINIYGATAIFIKIGDISRFPTAEKLAAYFGVVPSTQSSDKKTRHGRITKAGCDIVRTILVNAGFYGVKGSKVIKNFYNGIAIRRGNNIARVAVARKLAKIIWAMLTRGKTFNEVNEESFKRKIKRFMHAYISGVIPTGNLLLQEMLISNGYSIKDYKKEMEKEIFETILSKSEEKT